MRRKKTFVEAIVVLTFFCGFEVGISRGEVGQAQRPLAFGAVTSIISGASALYEVQVPKQGFVGSPLSAIAGAPVFRKPGPKDFERYIIRAVAIQRGAVGNKPRRGFRIDLLEGKDNVSASGIFFAFFPEQGSGENLVCRRDDLELDQADTWGGKYNLTHPLTNYPPIDGVPLSGVGRGASFDGRSRRGLACTASMDVATTGIRVLVTEFFELSEQEKQKTKNISYFDPSEKTVTKEPGGGRVPVKIGTHEVQVWRARAWLWDEMIRYDAAGNVLMKCKLIAGVIRTE